MNHELQIACVFVEVNFGSLSNCVIGRRVAIVTGGSRGPRLQIASARGEFGASLALGRGMGSRNIRVNALAPGYFPSKMTRAILEKHGDGILRQTQLGKFGGDTDLMGAVLLLASDAGGHITGQTLVIDGGASII